MLFLMGLLMFRCVESPVYLIPLAFAFPMGLGVWLGGLWLPFSWSGYVFYFAHAVYTLVGCPQRTRFLAMYVVLIPALVLNIGGCMMLGGLHPN